MTRESVESRTSDERVERIHTIALKLAELTLLKTAKSRARCRDLAAEMIALLGDEDACERPDPTPDELNAGAERLRAAIAGCREATEQAEPSAANDGSTLSAGGLPITMGMVTKYDGWSQLGALKVPRFGESRRSLAPPRVEPPSTANDSDDELAIRAEMERRITRRLARSTTRGAK